jgi:hypothetical protein
MITFPCTGQDMNLLLLHGYAHGRIIEEFSGLAGGGAACNMNFLQHFYPKNSTLGTFAYTSGNI